VGVALRFSNALTEPSRASAEPVVELELHFARELHDQVASPLIQLVVELHDLRLELDGDTDTQQRLALLEESARQVLRRTRETLMDLRGQSDLRLSFVQVVRSEVIARFERRAAISLVVSPKWPHHINGWAAFNLSRIVHEAITNAIRHGHARSISVALSVHTLDEAVIEVVDDGQGFDGVTGMGMAGMKERAVIMGGTFSAGAAESGGTRIQVSIPMYRLE
jgi:signal transduction histidine kinase